MEGHDLDSNAMNQNLLLQSKDDIIKQLKRKIEAYEKNAEEQNQKLSDYDHLLVEFNSINQNYSQMQQDLEIFKSEKYKNKNKFNIPFTSRNDISKNKIYKLYELYSKTANTIINDKNQKNCSKDHQSSSNENLSRKRHKIIINNHF